MAVAINNRIFNYFLLADGLLNCQKLAQYLLVTAFTICVDCGRKQLEFSNLTTPVSAITSREKKFVESQRSYLTETSLPG